MLFFFFLLAVVGVAMILSVRTPDDAHPPKSTPEEKDEDEKFLFALLIIFA